LQKYEEKAPERRVSPSADLTGYPFPCLKEPPGVSTTNIHKDLTSTRILIPPSLSGDLHKGSAIEKMLADTYLFTEQVNTRKIWLFKWGDRI